MRGWGGEDEWSLEVPGEDRGSPRRILAGRQIWEEVEARRAEK